MKADILFSEIEKRGGSAVDHSGALRPLRPLWLVIFFGEFGAVGIVAFARARTRPIGGVMQVGACQVRKGWFSHVPIWTGAKASDHAVRVFSIPGNEWRRSGRVGMSSEMLAEDLQRREERGGERERERERLGSGVQMEMETKSSLMASKGEE